MRSIGLIVGAALALTLLAEVPAAAQPYYGQSYGGGPGVTYAPGRYREPFFDDQPPRRGGGYYQRESAEQLQQREYNQSGTLGRLGLGADPRHPEGPGNQSLGGSR